MAFWTRTLSASFVTLIVCLAALVPAQPIPVEGTEMVPNEYGGTFPREITWGADGSRMVLIPYGTFRRGLSADVEGRVDEKPEKEIYVSSFYIDKFEVTNQQYIDYIMKGATVPRPRPTGNQKLLDKDRPVCGIAWTSARDYAASTGRELPTEAQWEKAARGPANSLFVTGDVPPTKEQVVIARGANGLTDPARADTTDVNGYGIHHMGGNVAEWCSDWYGREYYRQPAEKDPTGPPKGETRVIRGNSFYGSESESRLTMRRANAPALFVDEVGFRCVWVPRPEALVKAPPTPTPQPTPSKQEVLEKFLARITPLMERGEPKLPQELVASRAFTAKGFDEIQIINFSPYRLSLTFFGLNEELVFRYAEPVSPLSYRNVQLPREIDLHIAAYAAEAPVKGPKVIGFLRAESLATVVLHTEQFGPVVLPDGARIEAGSVTEAPQYYDTYNPQWNEVEILNSLSVPVVLTIEDILRGPDKPEPVGEYNIEPSDALRIKLQPSRLRLRANYFGALGESSTPSLFRLDDSAARRLFSIKEDKDREGGVTVITEKKPFLKFDVSEAKKIPSPRDKKKKTTAGPTPRR